MKRRSAEAAAFKPTLSRTETRHDATTRVAWAIIASEAAAASAKTERLRAARLAREAVEVKAAPKTVKRRRTAG